MFKRERRREREREGRERGERKEERRGGKWGLGKKIHSILSE